jgi:alkanesulfonate monooxygenase SsuD/methylene tetrahydromethanopterin reductase-like flavin-dependent oxidoreductase (luciferase family)
MKRIAVYGALQGNINEHGYLDRVMSFTRSCDELGYTGAPLHYNHRTFDPWQLAGAILTSTESFTPMIAVQPYAAPPFTVAKMIATIAYLYGRRVDLNLISGSSSGELNDIQDPLSHTARYDRLREYAQVIRGLLELADEDTFLDFDGEHDRYKELHYFSAGMPKELMPRFYLAGSSAAAKMTAIETGSCLLTNPEPIADYRRNFIEPLDGAVDLGVRFGIIARETSAEAWRAARQYFPNDPGGLATEFSYGKGSDSNWRRTISELAQRELYDDIYWLGPTRASRSYSPFLVGSFDEVATYLEQYVEAGVSALVLASPWDEYAANAEVIGRLER